MTRMSFRVMLYRRGSFRLCPFDVWCSRRYTALTAPPLVSRFGLGKPSAKSCTSARNAPTPGRLTSTPRPPSPYVAWSLVNRSRRTGAHIREQNTCAECLRLWMETGMLLLEYDVMTYALAALSKSDPAYPEHWK
jgi:hypothetical protein